MIVLVHSVERSEALFPDYFQGVFGGFKIWRTIFGLLFWDVVYAQLPDVFWTNFQRAPCDVYTDSFYANRRAAVDARLKAIREDFDEVLAAAKGVWEDHTERRTQSVVDWSLFEEFSDMEVSLNGRTRRMNKRENVFISETGKQLHKVFIP